MKLASAMDIKEFAEKYHENFATREEEEKAAKVLAKSDAQIELQNALYAAGLANFNEGELYTSKFAYSMPAISANFFWTLYCRNE